MLRTHRLAAASLIAGSMIAGMAAPARVVAAPAVTFNDCAYQHDTWNLASATSRALQTLNRTSSDQWHREQSQFVTTLRQIDTRSGAAGNAAARRSDTALTAVYNDVSDALVARGVGAWQDYYGKVKQAWASLNTVWSTLKGFCALGHEVQTLMHVPLDGNEYGDGIVPLPLSAPWLSVKQTWEIQWWFACYKAKPGLRIEVRAVQGNPPLAMSASAAYIGPLLKVAVDQHGSHGSGTVRLPGYKVPVYLVVRSQCLSTTSVIG